MPTQISLLKEISRQQNFLKSLTFWLWFLHQRPDFSFGLFASFINTLVGSLNQEKAIVDSTGIRLVKSSRTIVSKSTRRSVNVSNKLWLCRLSPDS